MNYHIKIFFYIENTLLHDFNNLFTYNLVLVEIL